MSTDAGDRVYMVRFIFKSGHVEDVLLAGFSGETINNAMHKINWTRAGPEAPNPIYINFDDIAAIIELRSWPANQSKDWGQFSGMGKSS